MTLRIPFGGIVTHRPNGRIVYARPSPGAQQLFYDDLVSELCGYSGGLGGGKTMANVTKLVRYALSFGTTDRRPIQSLFGMPTERNLEDIVMPIFNQLQAVLSRHEGIGLYWNAGRKVWQTENNHEILMRPTRNPGALPQTSLASVHVDEVTKWHQVRGLDSWRDLFGRMRESRVPYRQMNYTANPASGHWLKAEVIDRSRRIKLGDPLPEPGDWSWYQCRSDDNPHCPADTIERLQKYPHSSHYYRQMFLGEWIASEGAVYPEWSTEKHLVDYDVARLRGDGTAKLWVGLDPGRLYHTAILAVELRTVNRYGWPVLVVIDQVCNLNVQIHTTLDELGKLLAHYGAATFLGREDEHSRWQVSDRVEAWIDPNDPTSRYWQHRAWEILKLHLHKQPKVRRSLDWSDEVFRRALLTQDGEVSLFVSRSLVGAPSGQGRGLPESMEGHSFRKSARTGEYTENVKEDQLTHAPAAARYMACGVWGDYDVGPGIWISGGAGGAGGAGDVADAESSQQQRQQRHQQTGHNPTRSTHPTRQTQAQAPINPTLHRLLAQRRQRRQPHARGRDDRRGSD
jgi:hypothetical protein